MKRVALIGGGTSGLAAGSGDTAGVLDTTCLLVENVRHRQSGGRTRHPGSGVFPVWSEARWYRVPDPKLLEQAAEPDRPNLRFPYLPCYAQHDGPAFLSYGDDRDADLPLATAAYFNACGPMNAEGRRANGGALWR